MSGSRPSDGAATSPSAHPRHHPPQALVVFQDEEREALIQWDGEAYEIADWREAKVHQDHHIQCRQALYSVPSSLCPPGQKVEVKVDSKLVRIYHRGQLIKTHVRHSRAAAPLTPRTTPPSCPPTPPGLPTASRTRRPGWDQR